MERWLKSLPSGTTITNEMLDEQIQKLASDPRFADIVKNGSEPKFSNYKAYSKAKSSGKVRCGMVIFTAFNVFQAFMTAYDVINPRPPETDPSPYVIPDSENNLYSIGSQDKKGNSSFLTDEGDTGGRDTTAYFIYYISGPRKGNGYSITKEMYEILKQQSLENGKTLDDLIIERISRPAY